VGGSPGGIGYKYPITAERWNPKSGKGWQMMNTPATKAIGRGVQAHWDGKYVWAIVEAPNSWEKEEYSFRWEPITNTSNKLAMNGRLTGQFPNSSDGATVWVGGQLFEHGSDLANGAAKHAYALYNPELDQWAQTSFPDNLVQSSTNTLQSVGNPCAIASGDDVFIYNSSLNPSPGSGLDAKKAITLRFNVTNQKWSVISQAMPVDTITYPCAGAGFAIGTDTGFVIWGRDEAAAAKAPAQGAIYNKQTNTWTVMAKLEPNAHAVNTHRQSEILGDVIYAYGQSFLDETQPIDSQDFLYKVRTVAAFHIGGNSWNFLTPVGFPTDRRSETGFIVGDGELYLIGGIDGPQDANLIHKDGVRLALPGSKP